MKSLSTIYYVQFGGLNPGVVGRSGVMGNNEKQAAISANDEPEYQQQLSVPGRTMSDTYSCKDVSQLLDITEGRLRYWDRSGFLCPSGYQGRRRRYTFQDLVGLRSAKILLDSGVSLQKTRRLIKSLQEKIPSSSHPLNRLRIMSNSKTVTVVDQEKEFEADSGQLLLDFQVSAFEKEIVKKLPHTAEKPLEDLTAYEWYLEGCRFDEDEETLAIAEEAYHRAIHLDPSLANAYTNLGNLLYRTGCLEDARTLYEKAIAVDKMQPEAHYNLGFFEFESGNMERAEACFTRAVELDGTFADAHFNVAMTLFRLGHYERARYHLQHYLSIEPTGPWADIARRRLNDMS
jgi:tetratricopeptide (TPR) repeat protein